MRTTFTWFELRKLRARPLALVPESPPQRYAVDVPGLPAEFRHALKARGFDLERQIAAEAVMAPGRGYSLRFSQDE